MIVRAKFYVNTVDKENGRVELWPVTSGSPENEQYYKWTPAGNIVLQTINDHAIQQFTQGKEFYVDFTPSEETS